MCPWQGCAHATMAIWWVLSSPVPTYSLNPGCCTLREACTLILFHIRAHSAGPNRQWCNPPAVHESNRGCEDERVHTACCQDLTFGSTPATRRVLLRAQRGTRNAGLKYSRSLMPASLTFGLCGRRYSLWAARCAS
ncbi:hypothetical protein V8C86DRAFT_2612611, partial [Haematococcus lacustris]